MASVGSSDPAGAPGGDSTAQGEEPRPPDDEWLKESTYGNRWLLYLRSPKGKAFDRTLVRWTGLSLITWAFARVGKKSYQPTLLLTTIGCRTGRLRSSALPYFPVGDDLVVVGSAGGGPNDPKWVSNLRADSHCWLTIRRRTVPATGRTATGAEREQLFEEVAKTHLGLRDYQTSARRYGRDVPLVVLSLR
jgi:deazaflavin-dependent oxidoreductase (nitroreductase family)